MSALDPITDKLGKLLRLLGSDQDGPGSTFMCWQTASMAITESPSRLTDAASKTVAAKSRKSAAIFVVLMLSTSRLGARSRVNVRLEKPGLTGKSANLLQIWFGGRYAAATRLRDRSSGCDRFS
jgi:hypothetical protein